MRLPIWLPPKIGTGKHLILDYEEKYVSCFLVYMKANNRVLSFTQIIALYVTGALNTVLSSEHQKEIRRYLYNHQARIHF